MRVNISTRTPSLPCESSPRSTIAPKPANGPSLTSTRSPALNARLRSLGRVFAHEGLECTKRRDRVAIEANNARSDLEEIEHALNLADALIFALDLEIRDHDYAGKHRRRRSALDRNLIAAAVDSGHDARLDHHRQPLADIALDEHLHHRMLTKPAR